LRIIHYFQSHKHIISSVGYHVTQNESQLVATFTMARVHSLLLNDL